MDDVKRAVLGVVAGAERRGVTKREAMLLTLLVARSLGREKEWGFGPRGESEVVARVLEELYDSGVVTLRFERGRGTPLYVAVEVNPEDMDSVEYQTGYTLSNSLLIAARLREDEVEALARLLAPEYFEEEKPSIDIVARLVAKGAMSLETASRLTGYDRRELEERVERLRRSLVELLALSEAGKEG